MRKKTYSLLYLSLGTLAILGYIGMFEKSLSIPTPLLIVGVIFYLLFMTFTIFIHPLLCILRLIKKKGKRKTLWIHLLWSVTIILSFCFLICNKGYIITV